ncbi:hypothetical protein AA313_de0205519 [Arthrobotrys entomopaga]|nr:hypothetical protein AA313_de0205519 [Arthrobotrys entomopaga]
MKYTLLLLLATCAIAKPMANPNEDIILDRPNPETGAPVIGHEDRKDEARKIREEEKHADKEKRKEWKHDRDDYEDRYRDHDHEDHIAREERKEDEIEGM